MFTFPNEGQVGLGIQTGGESSGSPATIFLARQLAHCPAWLEKNELVTKLHKGQIVPIVWSTELASPDTRNRYVEGLDFIDNRRLKSPLIHETLDQYKQRQIDVLGRSASQDRAFEGEYEMWVDKVRAMGKMEWCPRRTTRQLCSLRAMDLNSSKPRAREKRSACQRGIADEADKISLVLAD